MIMIHYKVGHKKLLNVHKIFDILHVLFFSFFSFSKKKNYFEKMEIEPMEAQGTTFSLDSILYHVYLYPCFFLEKRHS